MEKKMQRCPDGHVFDSAAHQTCPQCGQGAVASAGTGPGAQGRIVGKSDLLPSLDATITIPFSWLIRGGAGFAAAAIGFIIWSILPERSAQPPIASEQPGAGSPTARQTAPASRATTSPAQLNQQEVSSAHSAKEKPSRSDDTRVISRPDSLPSQTDRPQPQPEPPPQRSDASSAKLAAAPEDRTAYRAPTDRDILPTTGINPGSVPAPAAQPATPSAGPQQHSSLPQPVPQQSAWPQQDARIAPSPGPQTGLPTPPGLVPAPQQVPGNLADELTDWGIPAQADIQSNIGSRTPVELPGGKRISTQELLQIGRQSRLVDVLDERRRHVTIPGAIHVPGGGNFGEGRFDDNLQSQLTKVLATLTDGNLDAPLVFFCQGAQCWESYNAALRALKIGHRHVIWYRGGLASWKAANLPLRRPAAVYRIR